MMIQLLDTIAHQLHGWHLFPRSWLKRICAAYDRELGAS